MSEQRALDGLRIVDASAGVAGGYCTKLLAGLGADVIKVERPGTGDLIRRSGPFPADVPHLETSAQQLHLAAGKRSITLDVTTMTGASLLLRLLASADVFVSSHPLEPQFAARLEVMSRLVVETITPFGASGPKSDWRATEIVLGAAGGYVTMTGDPDREPVKPYGHAIAYQAGIHAALGIMAALAARDNHGSSGQGVDVAVAETAAFLVGTTVARSTITGREAKRNGARVVGFGPNWLYPSTVRPCADGYVHVHGHNRHRELLGLLVEAPQINEPEVRAAPLAHAGEIDAAVDLWLASRDRFTAVREAQELRIPFAEVLDPREVVEDAHGQHSSRGFLGPVEHPVAGAMRQPGPPVRMSATPWRPARAPLLGEHNDEIFRGELGLSGRELRTLAAAGIV